MELVQGREFRRLRQATDRTPRPAIDRLAVALAATGRRRVGAPPARQASSGHQAVQRAGDAGRTRRHPRLRSDRRAVAPTGRRRRAMSCGGTPAYMSPEEGSGAPPSEAGDWYSVGVTLYEALTGQRPVRRYVRRRAAPKERPRSAGSGAGGAGRAGRSERHLHGAAVPRSRAAACRATTRFAGWRRDTAPPVPEIDRRPTATRRSSAATRELRVLERGLSHGHQRRRGGRVGPRPVGHRQERAGAVAFSAEFGTRDDVVVLSGRCYETRVGAVQGARRRRRQPEPVSHVASTSAGRSAAAARHARR